ncbi:MULTISPECIES: DUF4124 domain-containing protein [unclassified Halomonas]|uniref:DUF4124 domain-containing protein n=1 Tax=unclassified Halomonas TaxID=2609666 RepID=UPI0006DB051B|nr:MULTISPECIES: DUF4124 domain-containing protein [unclassified Halomonas]KPQ22113.1 MAG: protein of unknown function containing DUF4124 domain [Halomonas sp. HL-93]SBR52079.1 protein of unknown function (DUF4124) [Halomonas sp. HL-93]SNY98183.1 protein of unknown function [Halomonas sp. hl-4]
MWRKALMRQARVYWVAGFALLLAAVAVNTAASSTVYRAVDENGNVTFSDTPSGGGEALELAPLPGLPSQYADRQEKPPAATSPGQPFMPYDRFQIRSPSAGAEVDANTPVTLSIAPQLRDDHQVQLRVNGELSQSALHSNVFWLANLPAGRHQLQAELLDSQGRRQHRTTAVTIEVAD